MTEIWDMLGHQKICDTVTVEWLAPTVGLIRVLYPQDGEFPYRGIVTVHIEGQEYEFKGMVFRGVDDAPNLAEHRAMKRYLHGLGYRGVSRRFKNNKVIVKHYGTKIAQ